MLLNKVIKFADLFYKLSSSSYITWDVNLYKNEKKSELEKQFFNKEITMEELFNNFNSQLQVANKSFEIIKNKINNIISSLKDQYNGSEWELTIETSPEGVVFYLTSKLSGEIYFFAEIDDGIIKILDHIDDPTMILGEDNDHISRDSRILSDLNKIIKEIKYSGVFTSETDQYVTLYSAKSTKFRDSIQRTKELPVNVFLTNSKSHAMGYAIDYGTGEDTRDLWKFTINSKYVWQNPGRGIVYYVTFSPEGKETVPLESIELIDSTSDSL